MEPVRYRGRFAPSPTGPLHFGSLVAAVGSYLEARTRGGEWLVRMEDVDTPRNVPGADSQILATLEASGFEWDGPVLWQSRRLAAYAEALDRLASAGMAYGCVCSRKEIADLASHSAISLRAMAAWSIPVPAGMACRRAVRHGPGACG